VTDQHTPMTEEGSEKGTSNVLMRFREEYMEWPQLL